MTYYPPETPEFSLISVVGEAQIRGQRPHDSMPAEVRNLMRSVPHALTIITSHHSLILSEVDPEAPGEQHGLLVSSFNTVTLHPKPFVSFNIKLPSKTYSAITASRYFTASGIDSPQTAHAFVNGKHGGVQEMVEQSGRLKNGLGGLWWMRCEWQEYMSVKIGDHMVMVGRVKEAGMYEDSARAEDKRLIYADGEYWRLGEAISSRGDEPPDNE